MKAAQFFGPGDIRIMNVPEPQPKEGEVIVDIEWCGICGSDLHEYLVGPMSIPREGHPHPITGETLPLTMGHEFCGRVSASTPPDAAHGLRPGQVVVADPRHYCRSCAACDCGDTNACPLWGFRGLSGGGGGLSERCAVRADQLHVVPDAALDYAAVLEPLAVVWRAARQADEAKGGLAGRDVLIVGGGPIGASLGYVLRARGAGRVFVSEPALERRTRIQAVADAVIDPTKEDVAARCRELTDGRGVDIVFDAAGVPQALASAFDALVFRGMYINIAAWEKPMVVPVFSYMLKEITMKSSMAYNNNDFRETVQAFLEGKFPGVESMVTSRIPLEDLSAKGFDQLINNRDEHVKILVTPKQLSSSA